MKVRMYKSPDGKGKFVSSLPKAEEAWKSKWTSWGLAWWKDWVSAKNETFLRARNAHDRTTGTSGVGCLGHATNLWRSSCETSKSYRCAAQSRRLQCYRSRNIPMERTSAPLAALWRRRLREDRHHQVCARPDKLYGNNGIVLTAFSLH